MTKEERTQKPDEELELEFEDEELNTVAISDSDLESEDSKNSDAAKKAKKRAKKLLSPAEKHKRKLKIIYISAGSVVVLITLLFIVPFTRWPILNFFGLRSSMTVTIQEESTKQPITSATVKLGDKHFGVTDAFGRAQFSNIEYGSHQLKVEKSGYSNLEAKVTNSFGETRLQPMFVRAIGLKIDVDITDWLSEQPVANAKITSGEANALTDKDGRVSLVIQPTDAKKIAVEISAAGYVTKNTQVELGVASTEVSLVPAQKNYFFSNRSGKFDLYAANLDGANQTRIIEATGKEDKNLTQFSINRGNKQAVLVATRDGKQQSGRIVAGIYAIDLEKSTLKKIDEGTDIRLLDWAGDTIAYTKADPNLSYDDPALTRIMSYNVLSDKLSQVVQTNYLPVALVAQNKLYYVPADAYRTIDQAFLTSVDLANGAKRSYLQDKQITSAVRSSYATLTLMTVDGASYELQTASGATKATDRQPASDFSFAINPSSSTVIWVDQRDGQGALLSRPAVGGEDRVVVKLPGLTNPVRFVSDSLAVVRVSTSQGTADYVVHLPTGKARKILDVSQFGS